MDGYRQVTLILEHLQDSEQIRRRRVARRTEHAHQGFVREPKLFCECRKTDGGVDEIAQQNTGGRKLSIEQCLRGFPIEPRAKSRLAVGTRFHCLAKILC